MIYRDTIEMRALHHLISCNAFIYDTDPRKAKVDQLEHCLQTATRMRERQEPDLFVFVGLVHDAAKYLTEAFHPEAIAMIVRERVNDAAYHVLRTHGQFQANMEAAALMHDKEPWVSDALSLHKYDLQSFDPAYRSQPLSAFEDVITKAYEGVYR